MALFAELSEARSSARLGLAPAAVELLLVAPHLLELLGERLLVDGTPPNRITPLADNDALGVDVKPRLKTLKVEEPAKRSSGVKVADVKELVAKLKNEARVI